MAEIEELANVLNQMTAETLAVCLGQAKFALEVQNAALSGTKRAKVGGLAAANGDAIDTEADRFSRAKMEKIGDLNVSKNGKKLVGCLDSEGVGR